MTNAVAGEKTVELLSDVRKAIRSLLIHEYGLPAGAIHARTHEAPAGASIRVDPEGLPADLRFSLTTKPVLLDGARAMCRIDQILVEVGNAANDVLVARMPSLAEGLRWRYVPDVYQLELVAAPGLDPIYPHVLTATVREWRASRWLKEHPGFHLGRSN